MKAIEKDRTRRYGSPSELAADVDRYLRDEPVDASPPKCTVYRIQKFVRRHKVWCRRRFAVVVVATLVVGVAGTTAFGLVRARQRDARIRAQGVRTPRRRLFRSRSLPPRFRRSRRQPPSSTGASIGFVSELSDQPVVRARLLDTVGTAYRNLGQFDRARPLARGGPPSPRGAPR